MSKLYDDFAFIYEAMYASFIDYEEEFLFYSGIIVQYDKKSVLELGSGTGNLANAFIRHGFSYIGLELSQAMVDIAQLKVKTAKFIHGDMRNFSLDISLEAAILTGRTISYLLTNADVNAAFQCIYQHLPEGGILCFDCIDANQFIPSIAGGKYVTHAVNMNETTYLRKSYWMVDLSQGMTFSWKSLFYEQIAAELTPIGEDDAIIRAFTINEIEIFLQLNGFQVKQIIHRPSYAFPTFVVVAQK